MSVLTASNGIQVNLSGERDNRITVSRHGGAPDANGTTQAFSDSQMRAIREFFQHERDTELGRWRWPENPDYVVYPWVADPSRGKRGVTVASETIPRTYTVWEDVFYGTSENEEARKQARAAARAYFDTHPEPKPWHDAKPGEAWELTANGDTGPFITRLTPAGTVHFVAGNGTEFIAESSDITAGRRIYPQEEGA